MWKKRDSTLNKSEMKIVTLEAVQCAGLSLLLAGVPEDMGKSQSQLCSAVTPASLLF
jgi:hypothetical protein